VFGDGERLRQVVLNLFSNAVKYSDPGSHVSVAATAKAGLATLSVSDHGRGIDASFLPHIFEAFRQADGSTTRRHGGLGLGLAIAKQIVHAHGGDIQAHSEGPGKGATFTVELPTTESLPGPSSQREAPSDPAASAQRLKGITVLVVDDDDDGRELVVETLAAHGAYVAALDSPLDALRELERLHPDVLVSDIAMPEIDGYQLLRKVRALPPERGGQTPALALTAHASESVSERALGSGFHRHLSKPIDVHAFVDTVAELAMPQRALRVAR
jgi:CheY-like chemotaxis protein